VCQKDWRSQKLLPSSRTLHQQEESVTIMDGMDMTLISYQKDKKLIEFAGALNPVYLIRMGELQEIKGNH
jgi:hypothetical protein